MLVHDDTRSCTRPQPRMVLERQTTICDGDDHRSWNSNAIISSLDWQPAGSNDVDGEGGSLDDREWKIPHQYHLSSNARTWREKHDDDDPFIKLVNDTAITRREHHSSTTLQQRSSIGKINLHCRGPLLSDSSSGATPELCSSFSSSFSSSRSSLSPSLNNNNNKPISLHTQRIATVSRRKKKYLDDDDDNPSMTATKKEGGESLFTVCDRRATTTTTIDDGNWWFTVNHAKKPPPLASCPDIGWPFEDFSEEDEKVLDTNSTLFEIADGSINLGDFEKTFLSPALKNEDAAVIVERCGLYPTQERRMGINEEAEIDVLASAENSNYLGLPPAFVFLAEQALDVSSSSDATIVSGSSIAERATSTPRNVLASSIPADLLIGEPRIHGKCSRFIRVSPWLLESGRNAGEGRNSNNPTPSYDEAMRPRRMEETVDDFSALPRSENNFVDRQLRGGNCNTSGRDRRRTLAWSTNDEDAVMNKCDWIIVVVTGLSDHAEKSEIYHVHRFVLGYGPRASFLFRNEFKTVGQQANLDTAATDDKEACSFSIVELDALSASLFPDMLDFIYSLPTPSDDEQSIFNPMDLRLRSAFQQLGNRLQVKGLC